MIRVMFFLAAASVALMLSALVQGDYPVSFADVTRFFMRDPSLGVEVKMIVGDLRLPRALTAFAVGAALAVAGAITQSVLRNPLAEPGLLGINGGAAFAAMVAIVGFRDVRPGLLPILAFTGAMIMALAIHILALRRGNSSMRIILIGIGLSSLAGAGANLISAFGDVDRFQRAMVWLAGSVHGSDWADVAGILVWAVPAMGLAWLARRQLDAIGFSDDIVRSLGMPIDRVRALLMLLCALLSAAAVSVAGLVGFVGLIAPHLARRLVGRGHAELLPVAGLIGGLLVMAADLIGRVVIIPAELPAGIVTALVGAPVFGWMMWRRRYV
jgi:iron complex transport system permease protein